MLIVDDLQSTKQGGDAKCVRAQLRTERERVHVGGLLPAQVPKYIA
jgi:hypothetical protein